jgi:hypothetical protein
MRVGVVFLEQQRGTEHTVSALLDHRPVRVEPTAAEKLAAAGFEIG